MDINFYNLKLKKDFEIEDLKFERVFDVEKSRRLLEKHSLPTYKAKVKNYDVIEKEGLIIKGTKKVNDYSLLLSLINFKYVFNDLETHSRSNKKGDFNLILSNEVKNFLEMSIKNLNGIDSKIRSIFRQALLLFLQAQYFTHYFDVQDILFMNCFEFLTRSLFYYDNNIRGENKIDFSQVLKYIFIDKYNYNQFVKDKLIFAIGEDKFNEIKSQKNLKLNRFNDQFRKMRNWINHGKCYPKPEFQSSPSNLEFTFIYRLRNLIRILLMDMIYRKDYVRKFDVLYQLILENNVCPTLTPDI